MGIKREIFDRRTKLYYNSINLRTIKFGKGIKRKNVSRLIEEQDKAYKQWKFYKEFINAYTKEKEEK